MAEAMTTPPEEAKAAAEKVVREHTAIDAFLVREEVHPTTGERNYINERGYMCHLCRREIPCEALTQARNVLVLCERLAGIALPWKECPKCSGEGRSYMGYINDRCCFCGTARPA